MQPDPNAIQIFVDGSLLVHQGRRAGYTAHVLYRDNPVEEEIIFEGFQESTINRMELSAVIEVLKWVRRTRPPATRIQIFSDSRYVIDNIPRAPTWQKSKWRNAQGRPLENTDLWKNFLSARSRSGLPVHFGWVRGKSSALLKRVDASAKTAARSALAVDYGYCPGKIGRAVRKGGTTTMFPAAGHSLAIRIFGSTLAGKTKENRIRFELYDESTGEVGAKHFAYAQPEVGAQLHRQHVFRVQMNDNPEYPQILRILEEVPLANRRKRATASQTPASTPTAAFKRPAASR